MAARRLIPLLAALVIGACAPRPGDIVRIALLAPFEGRYREVGYNALYAARLALREQPNTAVELLAVDDGGSAETAAARARALAQDPQVKAAVVLGYAATNTETQRAFGDLPVIVAGHWGAQPAAGTVFLLANPALDSALTAPPRVEVTEAARLEAPLVGGEVFALEQLSRLRPSLAGVSVISSGSLPDADFRARYLAGGRFVPEPSLPATLTYEAFDLLLATLGSPALPDRADLAAAISDSFSGGYRVNAPINRYAYDAACVERGGDMCLVPTDPPR